MIKPKLYTYRRCPYAIRSRLALCIAGIDYETVEISLKDKPNNFLALSPKGTVPVLIDPTGKIIDESLEIMMWALTIHDPDGWLMNEDISHKIIIENDFVFKKNLDMYKYADRFPGQSKEYYRSECEIFLRSLNQMLELKKNLISDHLSLADVAIFPFIRQFLLVDEDWFMTSNYHSLRKWLLELLGSEMFEKVMKKN